MTDPTGKVFISYRRKRLRETNKLVQALHDRGVPTWRDVDSLASEPTEAAIRAALNDSETSGAVLWITEDVEDSPIIRDVEVPLAVARWRRNDGFSLVIVLANGLNYAKASEIFSSSLGGEELSSWNLTTTSSQWATKNDIRKVANAVLRERLSAVTSPGGVEPLEIAVHAKGTPVHRKNDSLVLDWTSRFLDGPPTERSWAAMTEAAKDLSTQIKKSATERDVFIGGTPSLPAAFLLGSTYPIRDGFAPVWAQRQPNGVVLDRWRLGEASDDAAANAAGWRAQLVFGSPGKTALAVCISISDEVSEPFARFSAANGGWRATLRVDSSRPRNTRSEPLSAIEIASLVHLTIDALRSARREIIGMESIHLFVAGPAGFAFLLGTAIATLPPMISYEFDTVSSRYTPGPRVVS